jgi:transposase-like protein
MKKKYTPDFKAKVVLELLKEEMTVAQLSSKHNIHQSVINKWRNTVLEGLPELLADNRKRDTLIKEHEAEVQELYAQIGEISAQLNWLKKKSGILLKEERTNGDVRKAKRIQSIITMYIAFVKPNRCILHKAAGI